MHLKHVQFVFDNQQLNLLQKEFHIYLDLGILNAFQIYRKDI